MSLDLQRSRTALAQAAALGLEGALHPKVGPNAWLVGPSPETGSRDSRPAGKRPEPKAAKRKRRKAQKAARKRNR